jgi:hypothetical protein
MYRSIEHQLKLTAGKAGGGGSGDADSDSGDDDAGDEGGVPNYQELRELAADYIREHRADFSPYLVPEEEGADPEAHFEEYCVTIEETAAWGGHLELQALASALKRRITVYGVGMAPQVGLGVRVGSREGARQRLRVAPAPHRARPRPPPTPTPTCPIRPPPQVLGESFEPEGSGLKLCFLRHALGLGAHYNSTRRLLFAPGGSEEGEEGGGEGGEE